LSELRDDAWRLPVDVEDSRRTDLAFMLVKRPEEEEIVLDFVRQEIVLYANENPLEAKKRLYDILSELPQLTGEQIEKQQDNKHTNTLYQRVTNLLREIRSN
jgi:hypothetical protein